MIIDGMVSSMNPGVYVFDVSLVKNIEISDWVVVSWHALPLVHSAPDVVACGRLKRVVKGVTSILGSDAFNLDTAATMGIGVGEIWALRYLSAFSTGSAISRIEIEIESNGGTLRGCLAVSNTKPIWKTLDIVFKTPVLTSDVLLRAKPVSFSANLQSVIERVA